MLKKRETRRRDKQEEAKDGLNKRSWGTQRKKKEKQRMTGNK